MNLVHHFRALRTGVLGILLLLGGCAGQPHGPAATLAGTTWQLEVIQSAGDATDTLRIAEGSRFTLSFGLDGRAALRLDCNRGQGSYTLEPAADGRSGTLAFGALATTRALCEPPHLDTRVARDLSLVRSYQLKDGNLILTLADGVIYQWAPLH